MAQVSRSQLAVYVAAAVAIALIGARYLRESGGRERGSAERAVPIRVSEAGEGGGRVVVQVAGEVRRPGVYRLRPGRRVEDAVRLAGGLTAQADLAGVNLAARAEDGRQVIVPARGPAAAAGGAAPGPGASAAAAAGAPGSTVPVNLNAATPEQLDRLDGVGPATAAKIVAYRTEHGGFRSVAELDRVPGIGPARMAALKDRVTV